MKETLHEDGTDQVTLSKPPKREVVWRKRVLKPKYAATISLLFIVPGLGPLSSRVLAQSARPAAVVTQSTIELNGWSMITDSFDSSDPNHSTNGQYDPAKAKDNGDLIADASITNSLTTGSLHAYGHIHSAPGTNVPSIGASGGIGSRSWQTNHTGIEPGWWLQDTNFTNISTPFPDTRTFLTPTNGVVVTIRNNLYYTNLYNQILWGTQSSTNYYIANSLAGQTIAIGPNIVLALPNGLNMSGEDTITVTAGTDILGGPYLPASLMVYSGGNSCVVGGNGVINEPGFASGFKLLCSQSVTSAVVNANPAFCGVLIEPSADLTLNSAGNSPSDFIGYLMARSVLLNGNWNVHYDESLFGTNSPPTHCVAPPSGLTTWWPGDGNPNDINGHNDAIVYGGTTFAPGKVGQAFSFNGTDAYIRTNAIATSAVNNWSIVAWVYWKGLVGTAGKQKQTILYNGNETANGYGLVIPEQGLCSGDPTLCSEVGKLVILFGGVSYIPTGVTLDQNAWDHVALVRENGVLKLYHDGTLLFSSPSVDPNSPSPGDGYTTVGSAPANAFNGLADEIMFFDAAIPGDQVAASFLADSFGTCKPLIFDTVNRRSIGWVDLEIKGQAGKSITIYSSPDLSNWSPLTTLPNPQGTLQFTDTASFGQTSRFYKAVAH